VWLLTLNGCSTNVLLCEFMLSLILPKFKQTEACRNLGPRNHAYQIISSFQSATIRQKIINNQDFGAISKCIPLYLSLEYGPSLRRISYLVAFPREFSSSPDRYKWNSVELREYRSLNKSVHFESNNDVECFEWFSNFVLNYPYRSTVDFCEVIWILRYRKEVQLVCLFIVVLLPVGPCFD